MHLFYLLNVEVCSYHVNKTCGFTTYWLTLLFCVIYFWNTDSYFDFPPILLNAVRYLLCFVRVSEMMGPWFIYVTATCGKTNLLMISCFRLMRKQRSSLTKLDSKLRWPMEELQWFNRWLLIVCFSFSHCLFFSSLMASLALK